MHKTLLFLTFIALGLSAKAQNLIANNSSFNNGLHGWHASGRSINGGKPEIKFTTTTKGQDNSPACKIETIKTMNKQDPFSVFVRKTMDPLKKNKKYEISFWVKSRVKKDKVAVSIFSSPGTKSKYDWSQAFSKQFTFEGDGKWKKITMSFDAKTIKGKKFDVEKAAIKIGFGHRLGVVYVDNVVIHKIN